MRPGTALSVSGELEFQHAVAPLNYSNNSLEALSSPQHFQSVPQRTFLATVRGLQIC
jgi:hypothetical protein